MLILGRNHARFSRIFEHARVKWNSMRSPDRAFRKVLALFACQRARVKSPTASLKASRAIHRLHASHTALGTPWRRHLLFLAFLFLSVLKPRGLFKPTSVKYLEKLSKFGTIYCWLSRRKDEAIDDAIQFLLSEKEEIFGWKWDRTKQWIWKCRMLAS